MSTTAAAQAKQFDLPSGTMLGKYEILKKLATGGMAEIYLSRVRGTAGFEKLVVIKRILPTVADDPNFVRMFLDEARLAATLHHPNIADVYEVGEHDGSPFFAMEFVHGQDVRAIRGGARKTKERVPLAIALAIVHGTASALDYAHDRTGPDGANMNLVHRDVSSSNVLVSYEGAIKLIDFGIARATSRTHQTQIGMLKGKIPYMSPEQCRGTALDRRSDLFSLGVVMYELTAGRRPFQGENDFQIMDQIVHQGAKPPSTLMKGYPPELEAIVMKLLATKVEDRYQSAEAMLHDLDPFLQQHRLWVSPKPLSRYMRQLFAAEVTAWDQATAAGASLEEHLAQTVVSSQSVQSLSNGPQTPASSFPTPLPVSQVLAATGPQTALQQPVVAADPEPALEPKSRLPFAIAGVLALGLGGFAGMTLINRTHAKPTAAAAAPTKPEQPIVMTPQPQPQPEAPKPEVAKPQPTPEPVKPVVAEKQPEPSKQAEVAKPKPKPVVVKRVTPKQTTDTKTETKTEPKTAEPNKESGWDPNSPFLPPSK